MPNLGIVDNCFYTKRTVISLKWSPTLLSFITITSETICHPVTFVVIVTGLLRTMQEDHKCSEVQGVGHDLLMGKQNDFALSWQGSELLTERNI